MLRRMPRILEFNGGGARREDRGDTANGPCPTAEADGVFQRCPAGCCPHTSISSLPLSGAAVVVAPGGCRADVAGGMDGCPADLPAAPLPERISHLYACRELSTYHIAEIVGISRQRITRLLHQAGVAVKPKGAGRPRPSRRPETRTTGAVPASLYLDRRLTSAQISDLTGIPARTVRDRLRACSVPMRTRRAFNREDRATISPCLLAHLYVQERLTAAQVGAVLGVSRKAVLRAAHEEGLPVRIGGPPAPRSPSNASHMDRTSPTRSATAQKFGSEYKHLTAPPGLYRM
jgi:hypothetical protein